MTSVLGLEGVVKNSTSRTISGNAAEFFNNAPTHFSTIMDIVVVWRS